MAVPAGTYQVQYAKSGRAKCQGCQDLIAKDALRLGVLIDHPDIADWWKWRHWECVTNRVVKNMAGPEHLQGLEDLDEADQDRIYATFQQPPEPKPRAQPASKAKKPRAKQAKKGSAGTAAGGEEVEEAAAAALAAALAAEDSAAVAAEGPATAGDAGAGAAAAAGAASLLGDAQIVQQMTAMYGSGFVMQLAEMEPAVQTVLQSMVGSNLLNLYAPARPPAAPMAYPSLAASGTVADSGQEMGAAEEGAEEEAAKPAAKPRGRRKQAEGSGVGDTAQKKQPAGKKKKAAPKRKKKDDEDEDWTPSRPTRSKDADAAAMYA